jgi:hypothetical protein
LAERGIEVAFRVGSLILGTEGKEGENGQNHKG